MRPVLAEFAENMEAKLAKNDHKTEWRRLPVEALLRKLEIEVEELKVALSYESPEETQSECADVANFALMLWDRLRSQDGTQRAIARAIDDFHEQLARPHNHSGRILTVRLMGVWTSNNQHEAYMFKGSDGVVYYEDTPAARSRGLPILPPHATMVSNQELR